MELTVLVGGARAGKSSLAQAMGVASGLPVTLIATATAHDDDMHDRIVRHRADRPASWTTVEEPRDLAGALDAAEAGHLVVVDCLTLWTANLLLDGATRDHVLGAARRAVDAARARTAPVVVVTNEVGLGVVPATGLGVRYRDLHGEVNRAWCDAADRAFLVVAGRTLALEPLSLT